MFVKGNLDYAITVDAQYCEILEEIRDFGVSKKSARGNLPPTLSVFDKSIFCEPSSGLPILKGKKVAFKSTLAELIWFLKGDTNIKFLVDNNCNIWNKDAYRYYKELGGGEDFDAWLEKIKAGKVSELTNYKYGDCNRIYGKQWRDYGGDNIGRKGVDQISNLIKSLIEEPSSRYQLVTAWNPQDRADHKQALPACHLMFFCNVRTENKKNYLDLSFIQRSCDFPLGVPFNLLSYGILQRILCEFTGYEIGNFQGHFMDCHYYENQSEYVDEYIRRYADGEIPIQRVDLKIKSENWKTIDDINMEDFELVGYNPLPPIKTTLSVGL